MFKSKQLITYLLLLITGEILFPICSHAQTPTKQETIDWIKDKIEKYPGVYHFNFDDGASYTKSTTIKGYDVTTVYEFKTSKKYKNVTGTITMTFSLNDLVYNQGEDPSHYSDKAIISFKMPAAKVRYLRDNVSEGSFWWTKDDGYVFLVLYWNGDYDLYNRMLKALNALSDFNKPHESY